MATVTLTFTANATTIRIPGYAASGAGQAEFSNTMSHPDPVVRAVAAQHAGSGTTSGTVTITAE